MVDGYYWVWFYNCEKPIIMKVRNGHFLAFPGEDIHDEIDHTERPPIQISEPTSVATEPATEVG